MLVKKYLNPFILYNIPSRTGINMSPQVISELYHTFDNVKAVKEASGSLDQVSKIMSLKVRL